MFPDSSSSAKSSRSCAQLGARTTLSSTSRPKLMIWPMTQLDPGSGVDVDAVGFRPEQGHPALVGVEVADRVGEQRRLALVHVVDGCEFAGDPHPALPFPQHGVARDP